MKEAAFLFWPDGGPIKTASLRTAQRDGQLAVAKLAGKVLTTRGAIEDMVSKALLAAPRASRRKRSEKDAPSCAAPDLRARIEKLMASKKA